MCVLRLTLQDDTASLPASLSYHDFEEFFQVEQKAMLSEEAIRKCEQKLASLTVPGAVASLCLKSWEGWVFNRNECRSLGSTRPVA